MPYVEGGAGVGPSVSSRVLCQAGGWRGDCCKYRDGHDTGCTTAPVQLEGGQRVQLNVGRRRGHVPNTPIPKTLEARDSTNAGRRESVAGLTLAGRGCRVLG